MANEAPTLLPVRGAMRGTDPILRREAIQGMAPTLRRERNHLNSP